MKRLFYLPLLLLIFACNGQMKKLDDSIFIHDNSSKVWLIEKLLSDGKDYTPVPFEYHEIIVFHQTKNAYIYRINELGKKGKKMTFNLDRENNTLVFRSSKGTYLFEIILLQRKKIILKPKYKSYPFTMVLVPFPEY
ncbi:MAG: hypothetical protein IT221_10260 [Fluviicola sp.]|nr:hypothetical protein [Fluviicola sp.]